jgi:hypothetical protein
LPCDLTSTARSKALSVISLKKLRRTLAVAAT